MEEPGRSKRPEARDSAQSAEIKVIQDAGLEPEVSRERSGRSPWIQWAAILLTVFLAIQLLMVAGAIFLRLLPIFLLVIFAALLAFMLAPLVRGLIAVGFPRTLAAITVYLGIFLLLGLLISWLSGPASQQVTNLVKSYPSYLNQVTASTGNLDRWAAAHGLPAPHLGDVVKQGASSLLQSQKLVTSALGIITTVAGSIINVVLTFVIGFYLLRDGEAIRSRLRNLLPANLRAKYDFATDALAFVVGGYVRAQVTMALIIGALAGIGSAVIGVHYSIVIGVTVGLLELIPILGALLGSLVAIGIASFQGFHIVLLVIGWFIVIHFLEAYVLGPRITGVRVDLHPLIALLSMLVGVEVAGLIGALFAVPLAGLINVFVRAFYWDLRAQNPRAFGALPATPVSGWRRAWAQLRLRKAERKIP
jgi:predicted PurR-regulated permease PerM